MENRLINEEIEIREKYNLKALYYKLTYEERKVKNNPIINEWLDSQKRERGENGKIYYCITCNLFFYLINEKEVKEVKSKCIDVGYICDYCGEIMSRNSYCCLRGGMKETFFDMLLRTEKIYEEDYIINCVKLTPLLSSIFFIGLIYNALYFNKRKAIVSNVFYTYTFKINYASIILFGSFIITGLLHFFIFFTLYIIFYIIYLFMLLIKTCIKKDK